MSWTKEYGGATVIITIGPIIDMLPRLTSTIDPELSENINLSFRSGEHSGWIKEQSRDVITVGIDR